MLSDDPSFTGQSRHQDHVETVRVATPFTIVTFEVKDYQDGRVTRVSFDWRVNSDGREVARRDVYEKAPRTRKAAVAQAKRAARAYAERLATKAIE
jgi:hypothetical protein